jgi:hypothetical protein
MMWKHRQEVRLLKLLSRSGLVAPADHDMEATMLRSLEFGDPELESEASLSPAVAAIAMENGWDGIAIISPFACLPGRLIEATYGPWARQRGLPVIAIENDGNAYPPNVISRIEIFAHNVSRGLRGDGLQDDSTLPEECETEEPSANFATKQKELQPR